MNPWGRMWPHDPEFFGKGEAWLWTLSESFRKGLDVWHLFIVTVNCLDSWGHVRFCELSPLMTVNGPRYFWKGSGLFSPSFYFLMESWWIQSCSGLLQVISVVEISMSPHPCPDQRAVFFTTIFKFFSNDMGVRKVQIFPPYMTSLPVVHWSNAMWDRSLTQINHLSLS